MTWLPRQMRTWIMGDGTINTALKGSPRGRSSGRSPYPETPAHHRGRGKRRHRLAACPPRALFQPSPRSLRAAREGQVWVSPVMPVFLQRGPWGSLESDLAGATRLPAWHLLPLIPGTSGLKIAVKVTLVYREKMLKYTFWT